MSVNAKPCTTAGNFQNFSNGLKPNSPAQKSSVDGRYRSKDWQHRTSRTLESPKYISMGSMTRCLDQNHCFLHRIQMCLNAPVCRKPTSENNCSHHHTKISSTSTEFRSDGIGLHDTMHWSQSQPHRRPRTNIYCDILTTLSRVWVANSSIARWCSI